MDKYDYLTETEYLYGVDVIRFVFLPYKWAIKYKLEKGIELMHTLYLMDNKDFEDEVRLFYVNKAINHNKKLLSEIPSTYSTNYLTAMARAIDAIVIHTIGKLREPFKAVGKLFKSKKANP